MLEIAAIVGVASAGALWRIAFTHGSMKSSMGAILREIKLLRQDVNKDIKYLGEEIKDHELRLRRLEKKH